MSILLNSLRRLAMRLAGMGEYKTADEVRGLVCCAVATSPYVARWLKRKYDRLQDLHDRRRTSMDEGKEEDYAEAASEQLDDILRRRETGSPDDRLYAWFCLRTPDSCGPCRARHGRIRTLRQWRTEGLPGPQVCTKPECGCALFPLRPGGAPPAGVQHLNDDGDAAAGMIGLREDNSAENMQQGFALMPFWSGQGSLF